MQRGGVIQSSPQGVAALDTTSSQSALSDEAMLSLRELKVAIAEREGSLYGHIIPPNNGELWTFWARNTWLTQHLRKSSVREVSISGSFGYLEVVLLPSLSKIMGSGTCKFGELCGKHPENNQDSLFSCVFVPWVGGCRMIASRSHWNSQQGLSLRGISCTSLVETVYSSFKQYLGSKISPFSTFICHART